MTIQNYIGCQHPDRGSGEIVEYVADPGRLLIYWTKRSKNSNIIAGWYEHGDKNIKFCEKNVDN